jgi:hypothetical protein
MPRLISAPSIVEAAGTKPKHIEEFAGRVNSGHTGVSVARMMSPSGWQEPEGVLDVHAGQAVVTPPGEWIRYSTPGADGAEYIAVCLPAFSPAIAHRDHES